MAQGRSVNIALKTPKVAAGESEMIASCNELEAVANVSV